MNPSPYQLITPAALAAVYAHAAEEYPNECCGFLLGANGVLEEARRCVNVQDRLHARDSTARRADRAFQPSKEDLEFFDAHLEGEHPIRGIYHSHPDVGAYFSETDAQATEALMEWDPVIAEFIHLVVDVRADGVQGAKAFRWSAEAGKFVEVARFETRTLHALE